MKHIIIYLLLSLLLLTGCNTEKLNERQKEILAKEGLSTNYDELEYYQKVIIERIEKALVYIEDKYNIPFEYDFYSTGDILFDVNPALYVYPKDTKVEGFLVEIEMTKEGYKDDYLDVYSKWPLEEYLIQNIQPLCPNAKMKLIIDSSSTSLDEIPTDYTKFNDNASVFAALFVDSSTCSEDEFYSLKEKVEQLLKEFNFIGRIRMFYEKPDYLDEIDDYNFFNYFSEDYCIAQDDIRVSKKNYDVKEDK